ncbi:hypothetical protein [Pseudaestuariivita rosea]|uniref:hypothetical protein n=1 Tax=Pseudaestuariivita rosea TaxID=2763263 RepID=UPI001ABB350F|nr:hypothetical protein [Pseudaestuariivita rosea]
MSRALTFIVPLTVLGIVITIAAGIGLVLLIVPGIWIYAAWCVTTPAVVVERAGFGGLNRSFELTREYRWPIVGLLILLGLILIVISIPFGLVSNMMIGLNVFDIESLPSADALSSIDVMLWVLINSAASAISYGLGCVAVALVYIRLRQIKDGVGVADVADVFD